MVIASHNEWRRWLQGQSGGAAAMGIGFILFYFILFGFCLGLSCESCDV